MGISALSTPTLLLNQENAQPVLKSWLDEARQKTPSIERIHLATEEFLAYFRQFSTAFAIDKAADEKLFALDEVLTAPGVSIPRRELLGRLWLCATEKLPRDAQLAAKESMAAELVSILINASR